MLRTVHRADILPTTIRRFHERRDESTVTPESLLRDANLLLTACGVTRSGSWLNRTIRDFMSAPLAGLPFGMFLMARVDLNAAQRRRLAERADLRYLLTYADPTGETAVRNVMRARHLTSSPSAGPGRSVVGASLPVSTSVPEQPGGTVSAESARALGNAAVPQATPGFPPGN